MDGNGRYKSGGCCVNGSVEKSYSELQSAIIERTKEDDFPYLLLVSVLTRSMAEIVFRAREEISDGESPTTYDLSESACAEALDIMFDMYLNELGVKQKIFQALRSAPETALATYLYVWESQPRLEASYCSRIFQNLEMNLYLRKG
jgi:hypothetical protein